MNSPDAAGVKYQVVCVCGGYGFPLGNASAARIIMVGKTLQAAGIGFRVLHCGPSPMAINDQKRGVYEGIPFEYTTCVRRPKNKFIRLLAYARALVGLTMHLAQLKRVRHSSLVYLYIMDGPLNLYTGVLCQLLGVPLAQELCEWYPALNSSPVFNQWLYKKRVFKAATGALVISKSIEDKVRERGWKVNPDLVVQRLPVLVDTQRFAAVNPDIQTSNKQVPNFLYCGAWLRDILFLVSSFAQVRLRGYSSTLTIVGHSDEKSSRVIFEHAEKKGISPADVLLTGCVDYFTIASLNRTATALLMPLWNDEKSLTRLPNKMGEYLASGRPVITSNIGDLTDFLFDNLNAYVGEAGSEREFTDRMIAVLCDPERATQIGVAGQRTCLAHLDYRSHVTKLSGFVSDCIATYNQRSTPHNPSYGEENAWGEMRQNS